MQWLPVSHHQLLALALQVIRLSVWLVLLTAIFAPLERFFSVRPAKLFRDGWATDLGWYFFNSGLTPLLLLGPVSAVIATAIHAALPAAITGAAAALPLGARMAAAMVVGEIGFYWGHRWSHEIPLLWRFHAIHHSAEHINFLVNTRAHPVDMVFTRLCGLVLLYACGLASPVGPHATLVPTLVLLVGTTWSFFIHANLRWRLGPLEELISSPAFHHWHHTRNDHRDHNYAAMLPFLDRVFGTFHLPKRDWPAAYGIDAAMPADLGSQLLEPLMTPLRTSHRERPTIARD
jgi:sterol desaturase/sphingolipid hydroxylase (fatty acid hydroxylase superfamily)